MKGGEAHRGTPARGSLLLGVGFLRKPFSHGPGGFSAPVHAVVLGRSRAMGLPWICNGSLGLGLFPSRRRGAGKPPQRPRPALRKSREGVWSIPEAAPAPGLLVVRAPKHAEAKQDQLPGFSAGAMGFQAHGVMQE